MSDSPLVPRSDGAPEGWESLAYGAPEPPSPRGRRLVVGLITVGVLVLAGTELGPALFGGPASPAAPVSAATTSRPPGAGTQPALPVPRGRPLPGPTLQPDGLGVDPTFDRFARECFDGSMRSCDELYDVSAPQSRYETYADTCAGRQPKGTHLYCTVTFPGS
jgi:hypothetical protein